MPTALDIAREYFPKANDDLLDFILWERTSFPFLKHKDKEAHLREQLAKEQDNNYWAGEAEMFPY